MVDSPSDAPATLRASEIARDVLVAWLANGGKIEAAGLPGLLSSLTASARASMMGEGTAPPAAGGSPRDAVVRDAPEEAPRAPSAHRVPDVAPVERQAEGAAPVPAVPLTATEAPKPSAAPPIPAEADAGDSAFRWKPGPFGDAPALPLEAWETGDYRQDHIKEDRIYCLECGKSFRSLTRHLNEGTKAHGGRVIEEAEYRRKWGLPSEKELTLGAREYVRKKQGEGAAVGLGTKTNKELKTLLTAFYEAVVPSLAELPNAVWEPLLERVPEGMTPAIFTKTVPDADRVVAAANRARRARNKDYGLVYEALSGLGANHRVRLAREIWWRKLSEAERAKLAPKTPEDFAKEDMQRIEEDLEEGGAAATE